jgi:hypothetical protein
MAIVYCDDRLPGASYAGLPISAWDTARVMKSWRTHVENRAYLSFLYAKGTFSEKQQASIELKICERKMTFWERHAEFDKARSLQICEEVRKAWNKK